MVPMASSSSSSATVAVDKATSDLLISPDWTLNIDICDHVNSSQWQAKDVVKALKKRLQHRNPKVQMLSLTLLETMVKNCGDYVHFQIGERNILGEMMKIVKKADMQVRQKILALLDSWQVAFGGPGGKYPQYYWAYDELRRAGVEFPRHSSDVAPIITPPIAHPTKRDVQPGYGMPSNSSRRLDETMVTEIESLSLSGLESMQNIMELLSDMLLAVNPSDLTAVKDEVIVELVNCCHANQKKLVQMLTTVGDEELLARGLELNDGLQSLLAKHDAIAYGSLMLAQAANSSSQCSGTSASSLRPSEVRDSSPRNFTPVRNINPGAQVPTAKTSNIYEDDEDEDEFAQLARRHSKRRPVTSHNTTGGNNGELAIVNTSTATAAIETVSTSSVSSALVLPGSPAPIKTKDQDMIDLLSITLSTKDVSPGASKAPSFNQITNQVPTSPNTQGDPNGSLTYPGVKSEIPYSSYVVPWAQPQLSEAQHQPQLRSQFQPIYRQQQQLHLQAQPQSPQHFQSPNYSSAYPPPPWAPTPRYFYNQNHMVPNNLTHDAATSYGVVQGSRTLNHCNSFSSREISGSAIRGESQIGNSPRNPATPASSKPFVPSYRLFEDLNVFGTADGKLKMTSSNPTSSLKGAAGPSRK